MLFKCRLKTLKLNEKDLEMRQLYVMCGRENEYLEYSLLWCSAYSGERLKTLRLQETYKNEVIRDLLFTTNKETEVAKVTLWNLWKMRKGSEK